MYIETVPNRNSPPAILLREGWRENGKVRKRTLANLSKWPKGKIDALRRLLKDEPLVGRDDAFDIVRSLPHGHVAAVLGTLRTLRLDRLIDPAHSPQRERVLAMVAARILDPGSKLATARGWPRRPRAIRSPRRWVSGRWTRTTCTHRWTGCSSARTASSGAWRNAISGKARWCSTT